MRCSACGEAVAPSAVVCPSCGEWLDEAPPPAGGEAEPVAVARPAPPPPPPRQAALIPEPPPVPRAVATAPTGPVQFPPLERYRERLQETFGYPDFRGGQSGVLEGLAGGDVLAVMPTGSGKSLCYVLPALEAGRTLVVSPLIALMQDQVESLQAAGVAATFINSNLPRHEQNRRYRDFLDGRYALLYVAPERFAIRAFTMGLAQAGVALLAVDEAHCISEWGHNFRPDYLQLGAVRERLGAPRTLALTATANPQVRHDIVERLGIRGCAEVVTSVDRPNLSFAVQQITGIDERQEWIARFARERAGQAGIVYARTRKGVEQIAAYLSSRGVPAAAYHAGLERNERARIQRAFTLGELPVIVATNAFGMGIDKPDVRYVIHFNMPGRLEAYYQEAGRAGRDGDPAECVLLYARRDRSAQQRFIDEAHPDDATVRATWQRWVRIAAANDGRLPSDAVSDDSDAWAIIVSALRESGLLESVELRLTSLDPNAPIDATAVRRHRDHAEARLREMAEYAETTGCRRAVILRYFGEHPPERCERCDTCLGEATADGLDGSMSDELYEAILAIREQIARTSRQDPFRIFENRTARELATVRPRTEDELLGVWGIGERRARWFGHEVLEAIRAWEAAHPDIPRPEPVVVRKRLPEEPQFEAAPGDEERFEALRAWRSRRARAEGAPAYTICSDRTLREIVARRPRGTEDLLQVWGLGDARVRRFGDEILEVVRER